MGIPQGNVLPAAYLTEGTWTTADGTKDYVGNTADGEGTTDTSPKYSQLGSLPKDPAALDAYLAYLSYPNPDATKANKDVADFFHHRGHALDLRAAARSHR